MRPQDIVILLKIICYGTRKWLSKDLAKDLFLSTAEVSNSLERSTLTGLIDIEKKKIRTQALYEFLIHGLPYVFPQQAIGISRGIATAHSHPLIKNGFISEQQYVWPDAAGEEKGLSVQPLYPGAVEAVKKDDKLYLMLALIDMLRIGKTREKKRAATDLKKLLE